MNTRAAISLFLLILLLLSLRVHALAQSPTPPIDAGISISNDTPEVSEPVTLEIQVTYNPDEIRILAVEWEDGDFEPTAGPPAPVTSDAPDGRMQYTQRIPALTWQIEEAAFGPATIHYDYKGERRKMDVDPLTIQIQSLLDEENPEIGELSTTMAVPPPPYALYAALGAAALAAVILAFVLGRWSKRKSELGEAARPLGPPDLEALNAIDALMDSGLLESGELKEFFTQLGDIVREYLHRRFGMPAHELTSFEILLAFDATPALSERENAEELKHQLEDVFAMCDLAKFAKHRPDRDEIEGVVDQAREFIVLTRPQILPESSESTHMELSGSAPAS